MRIITADRANANQGIWRPAGNVHLKAISNVNLQETLELLVQFKRVRCNGETKPSNCLPDFASVLQLRDEWSLPNLTGIIEAPIMRRDGSILESSAYDETAGLYLAGDGGWLPIPSRPMLADAALRELMETFSEFPFIDNAAGSVLIAAILTALQRRLLAAAPMLSFDAPTQPSGKSLWPRTSVIMVRVAGWLAASMSLHLEEGGLPALSRAKAGDIWRL